MFWTMDLNGTFNPHIFVAAQPVREGMLDGDNSVTYDAYWLYPWIFICFIPPNANVFII